MSLYRIESLAHTTPIEQEKCQGAEAGNSIGVNALLLPRRGVSGAKCDAVEKPDAHRIAPLAVIRPSYWLAANQAASEKPTGSIS